MEGIPWDDFSKIFRGCQQMAIGQGTKRHRNIGENLNIGARTLETDRRQTDGRQHIPIVNVSSRSLKIEVVFSQAGVKVSNCYILLVVNQVAVADNTFLSINWRYRCIVRATQSSCRIAKLSTSFLLSCGPNSPQLHPFIARFKESHSMWVWLWVNKIEEIKQRLQCSSQKTVTDKRQRVLNYSATTCE